MKQVWQASDGTMYATKELCKEHESEYYACHKERTVELYNALKTIDKWCMIMQCDGCPISTICEKFTGGTSLLEYFDEAAREVAESEVKDK